MPCLQSVGISSCLLVCCPSISFSVGLCSSQKPLVLAISHRCGCVLASSSGQTMLVFCFLGKSSHDCVYCHSSLLPRHGAAICDFRLGAELRYYTYSLQYYNYVGRRQKWSCRCSTTPRPIYGAWGPSSTSVWQARRPSKPRLRSNSSSSMRRTPVYSQSERNSEIATTFL